jgi:hypothetical protein
VIAVPAPVRSIEPPCPEGAAGLLVSAPGTGAPNLSAVMPAVRQHNPCTPGVEGAIRPP